MLPCGMARCSLEGRMSMAKEDIERHYAEVARMVQEAEKDLATGFYIVREARSACAIDERSEALNIYEERLVDGIPEKALVASRGCGDPVSKAELQPGETVLDLGCGGGVDAIIASRLVGEAGKVYGLDMTADMLALAQENAKAAGADNIVYLEGLIEDIPLPDESVDVVVSNCVINFSDDRPAVFREALRVLKASGRFVVSDIVEFEPVPASAREDLCAIAGTTNGMLVADEYLRLLEETGFAGATLEPKTIYTREVLHEKAARKDRLGHFRRISDADVDSKVGSAIIVAWKVSR